MRQAVFRTMQQKQPQQALREVARLCSTGPPVVEAVQEDAQLDLELQKAATSSQQHSDSSMRKASTSNASTAYIPKQLTAEATISRLSPQQSSSITSAKQRQQATQQLSAQQQQQQRRSFERRLEATVKGCTGLLPSAGASRKSGKQFRTQQKNVHEMFTVWTTTALYAAV